MSNIASPMPQIRAKFTNKLGIPLSGCKVYTYEPNSDIPKTTWLDIDKTTENTNPILLDAAGEADIFLDGLYRVVVKDRFGFAVYDVEKTGVELGASFVVSADGSTQQDINDFGGAKWRNKAGGYALGATVKLDNGDIVKSTIDGNTNDPNVDMMGWLNIGNVSWVESIADLLAIQNPKDGQVAFVRHYDLEQGILDGGGIFIYRSNKALINDGGLVVDGWVRQFDGSDIWVEWFGAIGDGSNDDYHAINATINASISTAYQGSWNATSNRAPKYNVRLGRGVFRITQPILLPPYLNFSGSGSRWYFSEANSTIIKPDFADNLQFALRSANYEVSTGELIPEGWYSGVVHIDSRLVTATHGIRLSGFSIESNNRILGGIRLVGSPTSFIDDVYIRDVDCGVLLNCSWCSKVNVKTMHRIFGVMSSHDGNNTHVDGYFTGVAGGGFADNPYKNPIGANDPTTGLNTTIATNPDASYGVIFYWSQGSTSTNMTCEGNDVSLAVARGAADVRCLYSEVNRSVSVIGYNSKLTLGEVTGARDASTFAMGVNNLWVLEKDTQTAVPTRISYMSEFGNRLEVPSSFGSYRAGVIYHDVNDSVVYVNSTGDDFNSGALEYPLKTINAALTRLGTIYQKSNRSNPRIVAAQIIIGGAGDYTHSLYSQVGYNLRITTTSGTKPKIIFTGPIILNNAGLEFNGVNVERSSNTLPNNENGAIWLSDGSCNVVFKSSVITILGSNSLIYPYYLRGGFCNLTISSSSISASASAQVMQDAYQSDTLFVTSVVSYRTTYSGGVESRADKGFSIPTANRGFIKGVTLT